MKCSILATNLNQVHLGETFVVPGLLDVENRDDVLVIEVSKQLHLTQRAQTEHAVIERRNLLDRDFLAGGFVESRALEVSPEARSRELKGAHQTTPYAPSPTTSWMSY